MSLNPKAELCRLRQQMRDAMAMTPPAKELGAAMILAMVGLHVIEAEIRKTQDLQERRQLLDDFTRKRDIVEKAVMRLREANQRDFSQGSARQASMP